MMVLVTYDVSVTDDGGQRRLRRVAKVCKNYGQRVQKSVFECVVDPAQYIELKGQLDSIINKKLDSLRFYHLGANWQHRVEHLGVNSALDLERDTLIL